MSARSYDMYRIEMAISAVKQRRMSVSQAARGYCIPRKTIDTHVRGIYKKHQFGPARMLTDEEEQAIVNYLEYMARQGFPMTRAMIRVYIMELVREKKRKTLFNMCSGPSDKWFRSFFARHQSLTEKVPEKYDRSRSRMSNANVMNKYFDLLEDTVDRLNLRDKPHQIFNADETGWSGKERGHQKVIGIKGTHTYQQAITSPGHITAHLCISADGRILPTFMIFEKSLPHTSYKEDVPGQWMYASSDSGYMDTALFQLWFKDLFLQHCGKERPVLLVMDNHDSHINLEIVKLARSNGVELLGLPAHTTHILQPLDVAVNGPLKQKFSVMAARLGFMNKNAVISKAKFPAVLSHTIDQVCSPAVIKGSFRKCGLYPVNRDAIDKSQLTPSLFNNKDTTKDDTPSAQRASSSDTPLGKQGTTCSACGTFFGINPLVKEGLIPESLSHVFPPVPAKPANTRRKLVLDASVITSDEFHKKLQEKRKDEEDRKRLIESRKAERVKRKQQKAEECQKKAKKVKKDKKTSRKHPVSDDTDRCSVCDSVFPENVSGENITWIECDECKRWCHQVCVGLREEDVMDDSYFVCVNCCK